MRAPQLTVGRRVISEMIRLAAVEVPGVLRVGRGGPRWRTILAGSPIRIRVSGGRVDVRVIVIARPGHGLGQVAADVRTAVGAAIERLLGMELGAITVVVDGVGV